MKLFISYSRVDAGNFAKHIHKYLRENGHAVFIDVNSITIGDPWALSIEKNISDCDIFVVILTPDSLTSPYIEREVLQAQRENKIIVPCIHEHVEYSEIKWGLQENQGIEFSDRYELALNLYPKIKNYTYKVNEKPSFQQKTIRNTNISKDIDALNEKGNVLVDRGKYQDAIEYYDKALGIDQNNINALNGKSVALHKQGKYKGAIGWYNRVLKVDPNNIWAIANKKLAFAGLFGEKPLVQEDKKSALEQLSKGKPYSNSDPTSRGTMPKGWKPKK